MSSREFLPVAILAGGLATRLRPITETIPKALVPVAGEPFLMHQLRYLRGQGAEKVVLCTGHLTEQIDAFLLSSDKFGLSVEISPDGDTLLGTAGALKRAEAKLGDAFFVLYGDSFLPCDFSAVQATFETGRRPALMTVFSNGDRWDKSNVLFRNGGIMRYDKRAPTPDMKHIDYGLGILSRTAMERIPPGTVADLADLYTELSVDGLLSGHEVHERFYEIGSHAGLKETEVFLRQFTKGARDRRKRERP